MSQGLPELVEGARLARNRVLLF